ncbi:MAG: M14 family zinc carboxypeptidase [Gammaproteobacteria bacterium]
MKMICTVIALVLLHAGASAADVAEGWPKDTERVVVRAFFDDVETLQKFAQHTAPWSIDRRKNYLIVDANEQQFADMRAAGFRVEIDERRTAELLAPRRRGVDQRAGVPGFECYRTVDETYASAEALAAANPDLVSWVDVGDSWEKQTGFGGDDMRVLKLTNANIGGDKPKLFITSAIHAREYATAELNTRFGEYLVNGYGSDADATWLLDFHEVHLMLMANPDGRRRAEDGILWRKNTNQNYCAAGSNDRGADLNRNFDFQWGCCNGSSGDQCSGVYRGPAAGSEPESASVQDYARSLFEDLRGPNETDIAPTDTPGVYIDIHSFSELVLWPWGYTNTPSPNAAGLQTLGRKLAFFNDYQPIRIVDLVVADGSTADFVYGELGTAAYAYELGTAFFQDCTTFENIILPDNLPSLVYAAKTARAPYLLASGPDALELELSAAIVGPGETTTLTARIDDTRFNTQSGAEPTQSITEAQYTIDTPPWETGATAISLDAQDGSFNSNNEQVTGVIDTAGLTTGRHTIYVRGRDASGQWGVVSAKFLFILDPAIAPRISGRVVAADTGNGLVATISAGGFSTTSNANGDYELLVLAGSYSLTVTPDDATYGTQELQGVAAVDSQTTMQNFSLFPFCEVFADDMETTDVAWQTEGNWARTNAQSASGSFSYTDSPAGNYANNENFSLVSPPLDLSGIGTIELGIASLCRTEATFDFCVVEVSRDGASWIELGRFDGNETSFSTRSFSTGAVADAAQARVRFRLSTDVFVTDDGWYVDDVVIRGAGAQCVTTVDTDGDGISDLVDNCTLAANPAQLDTNGDGFGNACDADLNNDNIVNVVDLGLLRSAFFQTGALDSDFNGDGVTNVIDLGIMRSRFFQPPGPSANSGQ